MKLHCALILVVLARMPLLVSAFDNTQGSDDVSFLQRSLEFGHAEAPFDSPSGSSVGDLPPLPPILFLKTHKTGSSTVANIMHRLGERRNLSFMLPVDDTHLGYPHAFPGTQETLLYGSPANQFDMICNHAVLNTSLMYGYLKPHPHFITVLREPESQMISVKNWFGSEYSWDAWLTAMERAEQIRADEVVGDEWLTQKLRYKNFQAFDLGWYDFVGGTIEFDHAYTTISEWLAALDTELSSVVLLEHFDQGLSLFRQKLQPDLDLQELTYVVFKTNEEKIYPTDEQRLRLATLSNVDRQLYAHLNQSFWQEWFNGNVSKLEGDAAILKHLSHEQQHACDVGDSERCPPSMTMDGRQYTAHLKTRLGDTPAF